MKISIITATYNSEVFLSDAIDSYAKQTYANKELIVVDGQSTDATLSILNQNNKHITSLISEKDNGIYDALNKGVALAQGDIIGILHSDDFLAHHQVLEKVNQKFNEEPAIDAIYGDLQYVDRQNPNKILRNWISGSYDIYNFKKGWMPPHPALFIKKACFHKFGNYNLAFKSAADYDLILRFLFKNQIKVAYLPQVLVKMRVGGLSNKSLKNRLRANREDRLALQINGVPNPLLVSVIKPLSKLNQFWKKNI
ncbi:MAG TPA: glycosyltransferase family 2 protein [Pelobium sp.]